MVQVRKEAVRDKILRAAEALFAQTGFKKTTVEAIAKKAGIATGNVYTYYPTKKALFNAVITPEFVAEFSRLTRSRITAFDQPGGIDPSQPYTEGEAGKLLHLWITNRHKTIILLARSDGTVHESFSRQYVQDMTAQALAQIRSRHPQMNITPLLQFMLQKALADTVQGIVYILEHFEDEATILAAFSAGTAFHLGGLAALADWANRQESAV